jgi:hypothetical protein
MNGLRFALGILTLFAATPVANASTCGSAPSCGFSTEGLQGGAKALYQRTLKKGVKAISCVRDRKCQARLVSYFNCRGQAGRAARNSRHSTGDACDFSRRHEAVVAREKQGLGTQRVDHSRRHGGGIHEQNPRGAKGQKRHRSYKPRYASN